MNALHLSAELKNKNFSNASNESDKIKLRATSASTVWKNPKIYVEKVAKPIPGPRDLLLKISYCGICGSDFHLAQNNTAGNLFYPGLLSLPNIIGHEFSGIISEHGENLSAKEKAALPLGTPVTAEEMLWCGECNACRAGHVNHCENLEEIGFTINGAHAEYLKIGYKYCWSLQSLAEKFGLEQALQRGALVEPYAVAYRALFQGAHNSTWLPGNTILIFGAGPIGLATIDLAKAAGATKIGVIEIQPDRRELAKKFGATATTSALNIAELKNWAMSWTENKNIDWIVDAAGATDLASGLSGELLAIGGSLCLLARTDEEGALNSEALITKNTKIFGSQGHSGQSAFPRIISLMSSGLIHPEMMIERIVSIDEAQKILQNQKKFAGKILEQPSLEA